MDIDNLLQDLDNALLDNKLKISASSVSASVSEEQENKPKSPSNATAMGNIDNLLEDLECAIFDDHDDVGNSVAPATEQNAIESNRKFDEKDKDIEAVKKELSSKYSGYGYDIHKKLKESASKSNEFSKTRTSWRCNTAPDKNQLAATSIVTGKVDVYAEPIFGLRLINPLVSSQFIQTKMTGKQPVAVENIAYHLRCGDKNTDWVFAGAIVFKSPLKTSQKGSQYCIWKISDLKRDLRTVSVYLFSKACSDLWKMTIGTVVAILNATPFNKDEQPSKDDCTLTVRSADQVMIWGGSKDYGICKATKKNGENCTSFVNKSACEFCVYHVKVEYNKFSRRPDLQHASGGLDGLRNKVLGKNEVFYGGKSFSALRSAPRDNKVRKRDNQLLNMLPLKPAKKSTSQSDSQRLEKLSVEWPKEKVETKESEEIENSSHEREKVAPARIIPNNSIKGFTSRLHMLKDAGQHMIETGETTRMTLVKAQKKSLSFATIFNSPETVVPMSTELESRAKKHPKANINNRSKSSPVSRRKPSSGLDFELHVEPASNAKSKRIEDEDSSQKKTGAILTDDKKKSDSELCVKSTLLNKKSKLIEDIRGLTKDSFRKKADQSSHIELHIESPCSSRTLISSHQPKSPIAVATNTKKSSVDENTSRATLLNKSVKLDGEAKSIVLPSVDKENNEKPSPYLSQSTGSSPSGVLGNAQINLNLSRNRSSAISANIHERKKNVNKMKAINLIKMQGGLAKSNPNRVKPDLEKKMSLKRRFEEEEEQEEGKQTVNKKPVLSQRFIDLMNARSKHEDLVDIAEAVEQQNYFNKLEKKEQLEEKMLSTFKVPCKAVTCLKCKYKWFSASDLCRAENHPIKVIDALKRFFKCDNCSNRTVSLEIIPLMNCRNCGSGKWSRAPMIRDKTAKSDSQLCIRGDEQKNLNSLSGSVNLNLLVPE